MYFSTKVWKNFTYLSVKNYILNLFILIIFGPIYLLIFLHLSIYIKVYYLVLMFEGETFYVDKCAYFKTIEAQLTSCTKIGKGYPYIIYIYNIFVMLSHGGNIFRQL